MRQPFVGLTFAAIIGIVAADWFANTNGAVLMIAIAAAVVTIRWPFSPLVFATVSATFFVLHSTRITGTPADRLIALAGEQVRPVTATGTVITEPKIGPNGVGAFLLRLESVQLDANSFASDATVFVHWRGKPEVGDEVAMFGTLQPVPSPRNPGEFDMCTYLARRDVKRSLLVRYAENAHIVASGGSFSIWRAAERARGWLQRTVTRGLEDSPDVASLICGTALGVRHQTADDIEEPFQQTGTLHLFAVAGLHVGIVARLLWTLGAVARLPRKAATALIIPLLFFYAAVTGLHTASVRAAVMTSLLLGGIFFDRKVLSLNSLAAAAFLILLWDSNQFFTSGFQLSFCVVGAIVLFAERMFIRLRRITELDPFLPCAVITRTQRLMVTAGRAFARGAAVSLAAWIGSLPLIYWYFHLITPVSLVANLAVIPIAYFVLALALLSVITAPISSALSIIFNNANWLTSRGVLGLVHLFAALAAGHLYVPRFTEMGTRAMLTVLDEGAGAAAHIRANGYDWLIDCGGERNYEGTLKAFLRSRGVNRLEGVLLTHGDGQHVGGAADVIADFAPREIYDNPLDVRSAVQRRLMAALYFANTAPRHVKGGDSLVFGPDIRAKVLYPPDQLKIDSADDAPLVVQLAIGASTRVLLESDAGADAERALLHGDGSEQLHSDILVKGQHHSGGSGSFEFIDAVGPKLIIASSRDFPMVEKIPETWADGLRERRVKLFRQDETGGVEVEFRGKVWQARSYLTGETFRSSNR